MRQRAVADRAVVVLAGILFSSSTNSPTLLTPRLECTTSALGRVVSMVISAISLAGSYGILANSKVLMARTAKADADGVAVRFRLRHHRGPGIGAGARRFSTTKGWPSLLHVVGEHPADQVRRRASARTAR